MPLCKRSGQPVIAAAALALLALAAPGCQRPLHPDDTASMHRSLVDAVRREIASLPEEAPPVTTTQPPASVAETLSERREELERMAGPASYEGVEPPLGPDLVGVEQEHVAVSLRQAIVTSVENNLAVQIARVQPAITEAEVVEAEAAFDAVFFTSVAHNIIDEPSTVPILRGVPLGTAVTARDQTVFETGIRKPLVTGGQAVVSTLLERAENKTPGFALSPDPAYTARIALGVEQPLLRGFGSDVNKAGIYLARNADRRSVQELKRSLLDVVFEVEDAYWDLVVARRTLLIRQRLLEEGMDVRRTIEARRVRDVRSEEFADAVATVERRQADVIRAQRQVRAASDRLKVLMNHPALTVGSEALLNPVDFMVEAPLEFSLREAIATGVEQRPEIHEALLTIDDTSIATTIADNARLPLLNLSARMEFIGLGDDLTDAYGNSTEDTFIDYFLGLLFEQPIGNRAAEANYRAARLQQSAALLGYRNAVQQVVLDVKSALRDVAANYALIQAARSFRIAQSENVRAMLAREQLQALDPVYLDLKFRRQETLATAEIQELDALASFNKAVARLYRAMGIGLAMNGVDYKALPPGEQPD